MNVEPYDKLSYKSDADSECLESSKLVVFAATATKIEAINCSPKPNLCLSLYVAYIL